MIINHLLNEVNSSKYWVNLFYLKLDVIKRKNKNIPFDQMIKSYNCLQFQTVELRPRPYCIIILTNLY